MSMEAASIAQHCQTLRLAAIGAQFASLAEEARQQNHSISITWKRCSRLRSRSANGARLNYGSRMRICLE